MIDRLSYADLAPDFGGEPTLHRTEVMDRLDMVWRDKEVLRDD